MIEENGNVSSEAANPIEPAVATITGSEAPKCVIAEPACVIVPMPEPSPAPSPEPWREEMLNLVGELAAQRQLLHEILARLDASGAERADQHRIREELFDKIEKSKPAFQFQLVRPLIERIATMYDLAVAWEKQPPQDSAALVAHVQVLAAQFRETLQLFGIDVIAPEVGEAFDRRHHFVMSVVPTADASLNDKIAETRQHGILYFGQNDRTAALMPSVVRPARVCVWKHDPKLAPPAKDGAELEPATS